MKEHWVALLLCTQLSALN